MQPAPGPGPSRLCRSRPASGVTISPDCLRAERGDLQEDLASPNLDRVAQRHQTLRQRLRLVKIAFVPDLFIAEHQALGQVELAARSLVTCPARSQSERLAAQLDSLVGPVLIEAVHGGA